MEVKGTIKIINETQSFGEKGFRKREVVITTQEEYPQMLMIEFVQDKCALLDNYAVGQGVEIGINLRGREWINPEGVAKYFNSIQGWRIKTTASDAPAPAPTQESAPPTQEPAQGEESDDLPF